MGKTRAEIQKDYRERKKRNDATFLDKERQRQAQYRMPASELSKRKLKKRRQQNKIHCQKYKEKKRERNNPDVTSPTTDNLVCGLEQSADISSSADTQPSTSRSTRTSAPLLVRFNFPKRNSSKKRSKALRKANQKVTKLTHKNSRLQKRLKTVQKRYERLARKPRQVPSANIPEMTPKSKTAAEIKEAGLNRLALPMSIRKKLEFANVLASQIQHTHKEANVQDKRRQFRSTVAGRVVKKYKLISLLHRNTGIRRCSLSKNSGTRTREAAIRKSLIDKVVSFFERDDVSRCMPGKRDATKDGNQKTQTRILNDYLINIHAKFCVDNPDIQLSFSQFCKMRPVYVKLTSLLSRNTCLCTTHQNMALKLSCLRSLGIDISANPETVSKTVTEDQMAELLSKVDDSEVAYEAWQKVVVNEMKKTRIVKVQKSRDEFIEIMKCDYRSFLAHVERVRQQHKALADLKKQLPPNHAIVQMDFSENFTCQNAEEIQSAYWNSTSVTLHPVVVYYNDADGQMQHKSFVFVSDLRDHNAKAVLTIVNKLVPLIKVQLPNLESIHYWTDSPSSQYRNRFIFNTICRHIDLFGVKACWNYFESGHGKSACDGIGGTAKRQAADAVKQGKVVIQDTDDFFSWASSHQKGITYILYNRGEYDEAARQLSTLDCHPIPGTMKTHAVIADDETHLLTRTVSCYCVQCLEGSERCQGWVRKTVKLKTTEPVQVTANAERPTTPDKPNQQEGPSVEDRGIVPAIGDHVAAMYLHNWYIGNVLEVDEEDRDTKITFMVTVKSKQGCKYKWPHPPDEIWISFEDVLIKVAAPTPIGKSERFFEIKTETLDVIEGLVAARSE